MFFYFFYRCPINSVVPLVPPLSEIWSGARARQLYGAGAYAYQTRIHGQRLFSLTNLGMAYRKDRA